MFGDGREETYNAEPQEVEVNVGGDMGGEAAARQGIGDISRGIVGDEFERTVEVEDRPRLL